MAETKRGVRVDWEALGAASVPEKDAQIVAASLVEADLAGMKSHGVLSVMALPHVPSSKRATSPRPSAGVSSQS